MSAKIFFTQKVPHGLKLAWGYIKKARVELIVLVAVLAIDLLSKYLVETFMAPNESIAFIPNFWYWEFVYNPLMGLGMGDWFPSALGRQIFFAIFTVIAVGGFSTAMFKFRKGHWLARVCFALIIAGALGNFYDRMFTIMPAAFSGVPAGYNGVRDFFAFRFGTWRAPIFNIADMALVGGVIVFAIYFIFLYKGAKPELVGPVFVADYKEENEFFESEKETIVTSDNNNYNDDLTTNSNNSGGNSLNE